MKKFKLLTISMSLFLSSFAIADEFEAANPTFTMEALQPGKTWQCHIYDPHTNRHGIRKYPKTFVLVNGKPTDAGYDLRYVEGGWYGFGRSPFYLLNEFRLSSTGLIVIRSSATKIYPHFDYGLNTFVDKAVKNHWGFVPEGLTIMDYYICEL